MTQHDLNSSRAPEPVGPYPHAKRVGNLVFFSGVGPRKRGTKEIPGVTLGPDGRVASKDIEVQCRSCFDNLRTICDDTGVPWSALVDVTMFLTDMKNDFPVYNRIYAEYFAGPGNPNPTRTTLEILSLPTPIAVEVKAIAFLA
ncbi:MAG: RidA family protein [Phycisphaerae bacterium]|nr:RidA family protein [Phycisphaerae bacterium]